MDAPRKYRFSWDMLGDLEAGRPNLGRQTRLEIYRLMQFSFRDVLEEQFGTEATDRVFYRAGYLAGKEFCRNLLADCRDLNEFIRRLQSLLKELQVGILRVEEADEEGGRFVITISEDLDCSGLPVQGHEICTYDEGFLAGLLEGHTGSRFEVQEVDCWCTGDRTCRFVARVQKEE